MPYFDGIPQDPVMLRSFLNTLLRDRYPSLDELAADLGFDQEEAVQKLLSAGFEYDPALNQFR